MDLGLDSSCPSIPPSPPPTPMQSGHSPMKLRSDNGTEYVNKDLGEFLSDKGVLHQTTTRHAPEQNGAAKRLNRTDGHHGESACHAGGLWAAYGAVGRGCRHMWACYIRNRSPVAGRDKTS